MSVSLFIDINYQKDWEVCLQHCHWSHLGWVNWAILPLAGLQYTSLNGPQWLQFCWLVKLYFLPKSNTLSALVQDQTICQCWPNRSTLPPNYKYSATLAQLTRIVSTLWHCSKICGLSTCCLFANANGHHHWQKLIMFILGPPRRKAVSIFIGGFICYYSNLYFTSSWPRNSSDNQQCFTKPNNQ